MTTPRYKYRSRVGQAFNADPSLTTCIECRNEGVCPKHARIDAQVRYAKARHSFLDARNEEARLLANAAMANARQAYEQAVVREGGLC